MEDFIEIIFYVVILILSGIGSLMKNKKKNQDSQSPTSVFTETNNDSDLEERHTVLDERKGQSATHTHSSDDEENDLIRMLREAAEAAAAQQREAELLREQELRAQEEEKERQREQERQRQAAEMRAQREAMERAEKAKLQAKMRNSENDKAKDTELGGLDLDLSDADAARRAFIASEIFNKKYC